MATDASLTIYGLWHLAGKTVSAQIAGLDCGDFVVTSDTCSITVPFGSDAGGLETAAYVASLGTTNTGEQFVTFNIDVANVVSSVNVPVVIGLAYTTQGQRLRAATAADTKSQVGDALGKLRRSEIATVLLTNTIGISVGTDFSNLEAMLLPGTDGITALPATSMFTGVAKINLTDNHSYDSMFCWQVTRPWPCTVCATSSWLHTEET